MQSSTSAQESRSSSVSSRTSPIDEGCSPLSVICFSNTLNSIRPGVCVPLEANLTTAQGCKDLAAEIAKRETKVDVLVNNSGVSWGSPMDKVDEVKGWDRVFDV